MRLCPFQGVSIKQGILQRLESRCVRRSPQHIDIILMRCWEPSVFADSVDVDTIYVVHCPIIHADMEKRPSAQRTESSGLDFRFLALRLVDIDCELRGRVSKTKMPLDFRL